MLINAFSPASLHPDEFLCVYWTCLCPPSIISCFPANSCYPTFPFPVYPSDHSSKADQTRPPYSLRSSVRRRFAMCLVLRCCLQPLLLPAESSDSREPAGPAPPALALLQQPAICVVDFHRCLCLLGDRKSARTVNVPMVLANNRNMP